MIKTDAEIQHDVIQELSWSPNVTHTHIGVSVSDGIITLSGAVPTYVEKTSAEHAAQRVSGVKAVVNKLDVKLPWNFERSDEDIAHSALAALKWNAQVPSELLKVGVEKGVVELFGQVEWEFQREAAIEAVRRITGVKNVINKIGIHTGLKPTMVKEKIEAALRRAIEREAQRITVEVEGSKVILRGKVRSFADMRDARGAAFNAPGVTEVENKLELAA